MLIAAKLAQLMNRVLVVNGSAPWAFNGYVCLLIAPLLRTINPENIIDVLKRIAAVDASACGTAGFDPRHLARRLSSST
jgi:hypothetical protein